MASNTPPDPPQPSGFLSRLKGIVDSLTPGQKAAEEAVHPSWDNPPSALPVALPVTAAEATTAGAPIPTATPVGPSAVAPPVATPVDAPLAQPVVPPATPPPLPAQAETPAASVADVPFAAKPETGRWTNITCSICGSTQTATETSCVECGYYFSAAELAAASGSGETTPGGPAMAALLQGRFELGEVISERLGVVRCRGRDRGDGTRAPVPVVIIRQALPALAMAPEAAAEKTDGNDEEILPTFDDSPSPITEVLPLQPAWPSITWERRLLRTLESPALPAELGYFCDDTHEYLVEEVPTGQSLWDAWDDPDAGCHERFGRLVEVAEILHRLHQVNAMLEGIRPDIVVVSEGRVRLTDLSDLLPLSVPGDAPLRGGLYTAPELLSNPRQADARADLYSFGALLYALHVGRELTEKVDFDRPGHPKPFIPRFPDIHPGFGRLMMKTFRREPEARFPTDEASKDDTTGFTELIRTLEVLRRNYDNVRLEIASWTTTGIVRTGNEDAFALIHASESRQDDLGDSALILLCDGMGGYEAGEIAAALTIQVLRRYLLEQKPFTHLAGHSPFETDPLTQMSRPEGHNAPPLDVAAIKQILEAALREANRQVFSASRTPGSKRRGMGCTAEVVYVDGRNVVVGHVGDSRTYHLHEGRLVQLTRDQTLVNRLVELGSLTPEEAETHPRRNELQQAIGGQPDVQPGVYHGVMKPGDWVLVCSDGLTNHVTNRDLQQMLQSEATSAEMAARRLINLTNIEGATDNATVVVVRAT